MEFTIQFTHRKACHMEYGRLHIMQRPMLVTSLLMLSLILLVCGVALIFTGENALLAFVPGILSFAYWFLMDRIIGAQSFSSLSPRLKNQPVTVTFSQDSFQMRAPLEQSAIYYSSLVKILEGNTVYALYLNSSSAFLVPKDALTPEQDAQFRAFITPYHKPVPVKSNRKCWPVTVAVAACLCISIVCALVLRPEPLTEMETFIAGEYSISLPAEAKELEDDSLDFYAMVDRAFVSSVSLSKTDLAAAGLGGCKNAEQFLNRMNTLYYITADVTMLENGTATSCGTTADGDFTYYHCFAVTESEDAFWFTEFTCVAKYQPDYEGLFPLWAASIHITEGDTDS